MVEAAEGWLRERGVLKAQLLVRESHAKVVGFYERLGYEVASRTVMSRWLTETPWKGRRGTAGRRGIVAVPGQV